MIIFGVIFGHVNRGSAAGSVSTTHHRPVPAFPNTVPNRLVGSVIGHRFVGFVSDVPRHVIIFQHGNAQDLLHVLLITQRSKNAFAPDFGRIQVNRTCVPIRDATVGATDSVVRRESGPPIELPIDVGAGQPNDRWV